MHEFGHALGLGHKHQRAVFWNNIGQFFRAYTCWIKNVALYIFQDHHYPIKHAIFMRLCSGLVLVGLNNTETKVNHRSDITDTQKSFEKLSSMEKKGPGRKIYHMLIVNRCGN